MLIGMVALAAAEVAPTHWRRFARQDIEAAARLLEENHPGFAGPGRPQLRATLSTASRRGLAKARRAKSLAGYHQALSAFGETFADGHVVASAIGNIYQGPLLWPRFHAVWRGERMLVASSELEAVPVGSEIRACDGQAIRAVIARTLRGSGFRPLEEGQYWAAGWRTFLHVADAGKVPVRHCEVRTPGKTQRVALRWTPLAPERMETLLATAPSTPVGLTEPRAGLFLLGMPTFDPGEEDLARFRTLFAQIATRRSELLRARAIVLDLRGNQGGSSLFSRDAARLLWGKAAVDRRMAEWFHGTVITWRVSTGNADRFREVVPLLRQRGHQDTAERYRMLEKHMRTALGSRTDFIEEPLDRPREGEGHLAASDLHAPVYVLVDGGCVSACLDALDVFTRFPNTRLVGAPTSADTLFMEVRNVMLPGERGRLTLPMKTWQNRPRASGEVYRPHLTMDGLDWSTEAFLDRIEADLDPAPARR